MLNSWENIAAFVAKHDLQYRVERFNMSNRGVLVGKVVDQVFAYRVRDAARMLNAEYPLHAANWTPLPREGANS